MFVWIGLVFITLLIAIFSFAAALEQRGARARMLRERLAVLDHAASRGSSEDLSLLRDELLSEIPALNRVLAQWPATQKVQKLLMQADLKIRAGKFLLICLCSGFGLATLLNFTLGSSLLTLTAAVLGGLAPFGFAYFARTRRFRRFEARFPEAIELLVRASRAGHPFTSALEMLGTELAEPVGGEFRKVFEEQKFGLPIRDALLNLADRVPLVDVKFFVTTIMLQRESGGNLAEILDKLSYVIRERFKILRQVRTYTAQGRMTMMLLMALPPGMVLLMLITNPDFMRPMFTDPIGHALLAAGVILQSIGYFFISRIVNIKV